MYTKSILATVFLNNWDWQLQVSPLFQLTTATFTFFLGFTTFSGFYQSVVDQTASFGGKDGNLRLDCWLCAALTSPLA
jgi:hypothetical protein